MGHSSKLDQRDKLKDKRGGAVFSPSLVAVLAVHNSARKFPRVMMQVGKSLQPLGGHEQLLHLLYLCMQLHLHNLHAAFRVVYLEEVSPDWKSDCNTWKNFWQGLTKHR